MLYVFYNDTKFVCKRPAKRRRFQNWNQICAEMIISTKTNTFSEEEINFLQKVMSLPTCTETKSWPKNHFLSSRNELSSDINKCKDLHRNKIETKTNIFLKSKMNHLKKMISIQICTCTDILREKNFYKVEINTLQKVNGIHFCTETNITTQNTFCRVEMNLLQKVMSVKNCTGTKLWQKQILQSKNGSPAENIEPTYLCKHNYLDINQKCFLQKRN